MKENNVRDGIDEEAKKKISPVSPAIASALLLSVAFAIYAWGCHGSDFALSLAPALPVLAVFGAGAFAYTTLASTPFAVVSACLCAVSVAGLSFLCKINGVGEALAIASLPVTALICGASMGLCTRKKKDMKITVMLSAAAPCALAAAVIIVHSYAVTGSPFETLHVALSQAREEALTMIKESVEQMKESLGYEYAINAEGLVSEAFNTLPGTLVALAVLLSYLVQKAMFFVARVFGSPADIPEQSRRLEITAAAGIVYAIALALSLFVPAGIVQVSAHNIALCFVPALALVGIKSHFAQRRGGVVRIGCLPIILFVFLFYMNPALAVKVLALFGAFEIIGQALRKTKRS